VLAFYRSSVPTALISLFPDIGLDASQFTSITSSTVVTHYPLLTLYITTKQDEGKCIINLFLDSWRSVGSRRNFFVNYAKANGFDPLVADNWYTHSRSRIETVKVRA
jgi:hypothetical protein